MPSKSFEAMQAPRFRRAKTSSLLLKEKTISATLVSVNEPSFLFFFFFFFFLSFLWLESESEGAS